MASNQSSIASAAVPCYADVHVHLEEDDTHILAAAAADPSADNKPININECMCWPFYRALIAELVATFLLVYITVATIIGDALLKHTSPCGGVGTLGIAWSFGGIVFVLVYCTTATSGGHINPAITFGLFLAQKVSMLRTTLYILVQCLGAICGAAVAKAFHSSSPHHLPTSAAVSSLQQGYSEGTGLAAQILGTFVVVYTVFSAADPKRRARDSHVPILSPFPIGFAVFMVQLATIPITGPGINPAESLATAIIFGHPLTIWYQQWIFWLGPLIGAALAGTYYLQLKRTGKVAASQFLRRAVSI